MAAFDFVPVLERNEVPADMEKRYINLTKKFEAHFGCKPTYLCRAPGRVNLIGEHIDYCGYSVLPMAIQQDIVMAICTNQSQQLHLVNTDPNFKSFSTSITGFVINKEKPEWHNYVLCGLKGIAEFSKLENPVGLNILADGTVPRSAGLSSSSALVCCAGLTMMHANNLKISKLELADICAKCEQYIGTQGGGMDQSICFLAEAGKAKHIEFNPLRSTDIVLPSGVSFVICNSCKEMNKAATSHFNRRVVEDRLACQIMAKNKEFEWRKLRRLGSLQETLGCSFEDMLQLVEDTFKTTPYSKQEICQLLEVTEEELNAESLSDNTLQLQEFKLHDRAKHVFSEASRVLQFKKVCNEAQKDANILLGNLMNESHASCRDLYECSCPELDEVAEACRKAGAFGARLTGAGWGGCAVAIVLTKEVPDFIKSVHSTFYSVNAKREENINDKLFATEPGKGAVIYKV
ncbi:N-acetylgalactosamine kinase-like [Anneissia japonica]|uniref:N-acetylgalactosamine kinase-like n=1 Tax=Anneissia japonica TaxID=1529436 RepID=UPI00142590EB|nr:N-acetylgalactosamine kinase-like [Anneissia japonica]